VSARLAELLPLSLAAKQRLLEMDDARDRIEILRRLISSASQ
jgi:Lon protease-like protein